jgi:hypothetical protein
MGRMTKSCRDNARDPKGNCMRSNTATKLENQPVNDEPQLREALDNWREHVLRFLRDKMSAANEERQAAEDGLGIAYRNQGQVADDVISELWDKLEDRSHYLFRLARMSDRIQEMDLPELIVLFSRTQKLNTWAWEGEAWQLPESIF